MRTKEFDITMTVGLPDGTTEEININLSGFKTEFGVAMALKELLKEEYFDMLADSEEEE